MLRIIILSAAELIKLLNYFEYLYLPVLFFEKRLFIFVNPIVTKSSPSTDTIINKGVKL